MRDTRTPTKKRADDTRRIRENLLDMERSSQETILERRFYPFTVVWQALGRADIAMV
jgi:hypothetical protein